VSTCQRERGRAVIECGSRPISRGVADGAIRGEAGCDVIGNRAAKSRRAVPLGSVATITGG